MVQARRDDHIAVERRFQDVEPGKLLEVEQQGILDVFGMKGGIAWEELLRSQRALIIGEAGSGKSAECKAQQQRLWTAGEPAFFIELSQLNGASLRDQLGPDEEARFDAWLAGRGRATFFLDSVDELQLTPLSFRMALVQVKRALGAALPRAHVVATARPTACDLELMRRELPPIEPVRTRPRIEEVAKALRDGEPKAEDGPPDFRVVALLPLSDEAMRAFIRGRSVPDAEALIADLRRRNQQDEARRPDDLLGHVAAWKDGVRDPTLRRRKELNAALKLRPREDRRERVALSPQQALDGAERLALAVVLTRRLTIRHSGIADLDGAAEAALDPFAVLSDWTRDEVLTLLERGMFGVAGYGRVRFHNIGAAEHLAAERLHRRIIAGLSVARVKRMLFATTPQGSHLLRPGLAPVTAWLAGRQPAVFEEVLRREPEWLLVKGDPESLDDAQRVALVEAVIAKHGSGGWRGLRAPAEQLARIATPALEPVINARWDGIENREVRELLMTIVGEGRLAGCAALAFDVAMDADEEPAVRIDALQALLKLADARLSDVARSLEEEPARWAGRTARHAVAVLFPGPLNAARLCRVLARLEEVPDGVGALTYNFPKTIELAVFDAGQLDVLRDGLTTLLLDGASPAENYAVATRRPWLVQALTAVCARQWRDGVRSLPLAESTIVANRLSDRHSLDRERWDDIKARAAEASPAMREAMFRADDALLQRFLPREDALGRVLRVMAGSLLTLSAERDDAWLRPALANVAETSNERHVLLWLAVRELGHDEDRRARLRALREDVADVAELAEVVDRIIAALDAPEPHWSVDQRRRQRVREERDRRDLAAWVEFARGVRDAPDSMYAQDRRGATIANLCDRMRRSDGDDCGWNRPLIERQFDREAADRLRSELMQWWRAERPALVSERPDGERWGYDASWTYGLAGVTAEAEEPGWAERLSGEEARLACRYAVLALNSYPGWLEALARTHPDAVVEIVGADLAADLAEPPGEHGGAEMQNLEHAEPIVAQLLIPRVRDWLRSVKLPDTTNHNGWWFRLRRAVRVLLKHGGADDRELVRERAIAALTGGLDAPFAGVWLPALFQIDAAAATDALERELKALPVEPRGRAVGWFAALFEDRMGDGPVDARALSPELLLRLTRLAWAHVREEDDARHEGSYSPDTRDRAERGRSEVFGALLGAPGEAAWRAKTALMTDPAFARLHDRIRWLAEERAAREADAASSPEDASAFDRFGEAPPRTADAMFELMLDRLVELGDWLARDGSPWEIWARAADEKEMRRLIGDRLGERACGLYVVQQESVTADEKETDHRLVTADGLEGVVELKVGDKNWSLADLRFALLDQLFGRYLLPEHRRAGVLLITCAKSDRRWLGDDGRWLDFAALIALLDGEARLLPGSGARLAVRGLDLRPGPRVRLVGG